MPASREGSGPPFGDEMKDWPLERWGDELARAAELTSDPDRRAALVRSLHALSWQPAGRPPEFDQRDRQDLVEARELLSTGKAKSFNAACRAVASKYTRDPKEIRSIVERLRRRASAEEIVHQII